MFDPETLRTFIGVAETGSFSRAAERLCKTTATISYRIKLLEENTGVALFFSYNPKRDVNRRRVSPSFTGKRLARLAGQHAQRIAASERRRRAPGEYCG